MKRHQLFILLLLAGTFITVDILAQKVVMKPTEVKQPEAFMTTIPLRDMELIPAKPKGDWKNGIVPNQDFTPPNRSKASRELRDKKPDYALQKEYPAPAKSPEGIGQNFEGIANSYGVAPPDTDGDVGPNHYVQMVNLGYQIFDKAGTALIPPTSLETLWQDLPGEWVGNYGDPIVLYDELADRWFLSQFSLPNYPNGLWYILIAVSATADPTGSYHLYVYSFTDFPDYPKFGVWPDGYYMSINNFASGTLGYAGTGVAAFERSEMLNGTTAEMVYFSFPNTADPFSFMPADYDGTPPPSGTPNYFTYINTWSGSDRLRIYEFDVDWVNTANSTFTGPTDVFVTPFSNSPNSIPQLGTSQTLDALAGRLMFRLQYRNFGLYETMVTNHTVDAGSGRAGVRWYELRNTGSGWTLHQEGTYAPPDGVARWMASVAMNENGDIALGYSASSSAMYPAIRYTGRNAGDPLGVMTLPESTIFDGPASQDGVNRWGDYSAMVVDPTDGQTFWYTQEYSSGGWNWRTRIASFTFGPAALAANFSASSTTIVAGNSITFTDVSTGSPNSWEWNFPGGNPSSYTGQNPPPVIYDFPGTYDVSLEVANSSGNDSETKLGYISVTECNYCEVSASTSNEEWISNVTFNTINNSSNGALGYEDFTAISTDVLTGSTHTLSVTCDQVSTFNEQFFVFFDWNQNCVLDDLGEVFDLGEVNGPETVSLPITIPADAELGNTRMRVIMRYSADPTNPCESFTYGQVEDYTVNVKGPIDLDLTVFLEGPYNSTTNLMETTLNSSGYLPLTQPFNPSLPYYDNDSPVWLYGGVEYVSGILPVSAVDWVQVQCRDASSPANATSATTVATTAALLLSNGSIVATDGSSLLNFNFNLNQDLYVAIYQRNHIGVLSNSPVTQVEGVYTYNFTSGETQVYGGVDGHKMLESGVWGMLAGDGNANGDVDLDDNSDIWYNTAGIRGYLNTDYNLDATVDNKDKNDFWLPNIGKGIQIP